MRYFITFLVCFSFSLTHAQTKMSQQTLRDFSIINEKVKQERIENINQKWIDEHLQHLPIYKVENVFCLSTVASVTRNFDANVSGVFVGSKVGNIATIKIPLENINSNFSLEGVDYLETATRIQKSMNEMIVDTRVDSVWQGFDLPEGFTGKDVLIGITDWGYDYEHPMFMDTSLSYSRIRAAWDHFKLSGTPPNGMIYGAVYNNPEALLEAKSDTFGVYGYATHGSHVAGIAAGSGAGTQYRGVAFESEYLLNSIQLDVGSAIDAFVWMKNVADEDNKRLVINMSWGLYYIGSLDGNSFLSQVINDLSDEGVVFVTSGGNNGNRNFHVKKDFDNDTITTRVNFDMGSTNPEMWGQCILMWGEEGIPFNVQLIIQNNLGTVLGSSEIINTQNHVGYFDSTIVIGNNTIEYNFTVENQHPFNNRSFMQLRVAQPINAHRVVLKSFAASGTVHYWNVVELSNGVGNWGLPFTSIGVHGISGDNEYGVGEPASTKNAITVAAHASQTENFQGVISTGNIAPFSSKGPLYNGDMKPDISAPGVNVVSSINPYYTGSFSTAASTTFNDDTYNFAAFSGTSMSAPAVAGVCALILEANPTLSPNQVKEIIKSTARQDDKTGAITSPGSPVWGMGKLNARLALDLALKTEGLLTSISSQNLEDNLVVFPNPATHEVSFLFHDNVKEPMSIDFYNLEGKLVKSATISNAKNQIDIQNLAKGIYFIHFIDSKNTNAIKLLVE